MANAIYPLAKKQMLQGGINLSSGNVKVALIDLADYTYSSAHEFLSDVAGVSIVGTTGEPERQDVRQRWQLRFRPIRWRPPSRATSSRPWSCTSIPARHPPRG